jgi:hypothetical protein
MPWGRYVQSNITLQAGQTSFALSLEKLDQGLNSFPFALVLDRSPIQHCTHSAIEAGGGSWVLYVMEIEADGKQNHLVFKYLRISAHQIVKRRFRSHVGHNDIIL